MEGVNVEGENGGWPLRSRATDIRANKMRGVCARSEVTLEALWDWHRCDRDWRQMMGVPEVFCQYQARHMELDMFEAIELRVVASANPGSLQGG